MKLAKNVILASQSGVRASLLRGAGLDFDVQVSGVDEAALKQAHSGTAEDLALALAEAGMAVVISGRRPEPLNRAVDEVRTAGGTAEAIPLDVSDASAVRETVSKIQSTHGRVDALVDTVRLGRP